MFEDSLYLVETCLVCGKLYVCVGLHVRLLRHWTVYCACPFLFLFFLLTKANEDVVNRVFTTMDTYAKLRSASIGIERSEHTPSDNIGAF